MRKLMLLVVVGLLTLPAVLWAQPIECLDCKLGIWNELELINNTGNITTGVPKDLFIGIKLDPGGTETGVTGLEFSIYGIRQAEDNILVVSTDGVTDPLPNVILPVPGGNIAAPADTTAGTTGVGGVNVAWPSCISGSRALLKLSLLYLGATPVQNKVLKVLRRYPPNNPAYATVFFTRCDPPEYTKVNVAGGCFILGWDGTTDPVNLCQVETPVVEGTWTGMKQLYR